MDEFVTVAERAIRLGTESLELHQALAENFIERGECDKALDVLKVPMRIRSDDFATLDLSARAHLGRDDPSRAVSIYKRLARLAHRKKDEKTARQAEAKLEEIRPETGTGPAPQPPPVSDSRESEPTPPPLPDTDDPWEEETEKADPGVDDGWEEETDEKTMLVAIDDLLGEMGKDTDTEAEAYVDPAAESELKEGIEEADFFIGQGLLDEADDILVDLEDKYTGHPEISDRRDEIKRLKDIGWMDDTESFPR